MIVNTAVHGLLVNLREVLTIWLATVALAAVTCALVSALLRRGRRSNKQQSPAAPKPRVRPEWRVAQPAGRTVAATTGRSATAVPGKAAARSTGRGVARVGTPAAAALDGAGDPDVAGLRRYAGEVAVAAARAADAAERWRSEWLAVQKAKDAAWRAYERAHAAARRAGRAAAFPTPETPLTPEELRARERYLHKEAREAYRRGELSLAQLNDALSHRNGWDPRVHPFEQEVILRRIGMERKLLAYRTISAMESKAWEAAEVAESARCSLRAEAYQAAVRVRREQRRAAFSTAAPDDPHRLARRQPRRPSLATN
jgi:hypothetical protein